MGVGCVCEMGFWRHNFQRRMSKIELEANGKSNLQKTSTLTTHNNNNVLNNNKIGSGRTFKNGS